MCPEAGNKFLRTVLVAPLTRTQKRYPPPPASIAGFSSSPAKWRSTSFAPSIPCVW